MHYSLPKTILLPLLCAAATAANAQSCQFAKVAQLPVTWSDESLQPVVEGTINGSKVQLLFDTGNTTTALTRSAVRQLRLPLESADGHFYGVGGVSDLYAATLKEFAIGPTTVKDVSLHVLGDLSSDGEYAALIGADFALQMDLEVWLAQKQINFFRTRNCDNAFLGYWDKDAMEVPLIRFASDKRPFVTVELNGVKVNAIVDTGASTTVVTRKAAEKAGVKLDDSASDQTVSGIGKQHLKSWRARFQFKLGDEIIQNAPITVMEKEFAIHDDASMLLGQDWLRAHRVLFSRSQMRMIYSYLGGSVFPKDSEAPWFAKDAESGMASAQYAMARFYAYNQDYGQADSWLKKAAAQGHVNANFDMARSLMGRDSFAEAEAHLQESLRRQPANAYLALWLYLAQLQNGGESKASATLSANKTIDPEYWPHALVSYYLGQASHEDVIKEATRYGSNLCEADYYMTLWKAVHGDAASKQALKESCQNNASRSK